LFVYNKWIGMGKNYLKLFLYNLSLLEIFPWISIVAKQIGCTLMVACKTCNNYYNSHNHLEMKNKKDYNKNQLLNIWITWGFTITSSLFLIWIHSKTWKNITFMTTKDIFFTRWFNSLLCLDKNAKALKPIVQHLVGIWTHMDHGTLHAYDLWVA
jgi:hypothetical protein